jgi:hypothetical protein
MDLHLCLGVSICLAIEHCFFYPVCFFFPWLSSLFSYVGAYVTMTKAIAQVTGSVQSFFYFNKRYAAHLHI